MKPREHLGLKALLIIISLGLGVIVFINYTMESVKVTKMTTIGGGCTPEKEVEREVSDYQIKEGRVLHGFLFAAFVSLSYPLVASLMLKPCVGYRRWAYRGDVEEWSNDEKLILGTFWPLTLVFSLIVYTFIGMINRLF